MAHPQYRKAAMEKLASPDQLDVLMRVTSPVGWLALLSTAMLLSVAIFWGILGAITTTVTGNGILIRSSGIVEIECPSSGQVTAIYVKTGDAVSKGQLVARIAQPNLISGINVNKAHLKNLMDEYERVSRFNTQDLRIKLEHYAKQREDHDVSIRMAQEHLKWANERLKNQESLLQEGLIKKLDYLNTRKEIDDIKELMEKTRRSLKQIEIEEMELRQKQEMDLAGRKREIEKLELQIESDEDSFELKSGVTSPYSGILTEIAVTEGAMLNTGDVISTLEITGDSVRDLMAVLYVSAREGKRVRPGMQVQVSPSTVKKEEWGAIVGLVTYVSELPATAKGMLRVLQNQSLVDSFHMGSAPIEIYVDLIPDPNTVSNYKWSSSKGPPTTVEHGTLCSATIVVEEQPPISLVIPMLKKHVLGIGVR